mmetsp:Transcript_148813/g.361334  ORF Transcript_148813/g.361334 Transcript_148813/m.361334 type:complete len:279 (-) Transcript_148813:107-943(-)
MPFARSQASTLASRTPWPTTRRSPFLKVSRRPWPSSLVSSSRIEDPPARVSGSSSSRLATIALPLESALALTTSSWNSWRQTTTTQKSTPWGSSLSSASTAAMTNPASGPLRVSASTSRVARKLEANWWTSASVHVLSRGSSATTWLAMLWSVSSTRNQRRAASLPLAALAPSTPSMVLRSLSSRTSPPTSSPVTLRRSCLRWGWPVSPSRSGGPRISSTPRLKALRLMKRSGLSVSSTARASAFPSAFQPIARTIRPMHATTTSQLMTLRKQRAWAT